MATLTVLSGISGSGKSTIASRLHHDSGATLLSFDAARTSKPEDSMEQIQMFLVWYATQELLAGHDVIVDACNLHPHDKVRWETIAHVTESSFNWCELQTSVQECIKRDANRKNPVGSDRIMAQAAQAGKL